MKVRLPFKALLSIGFVGSLVFIGFGDSLLPMSIGIYSYRVRNYLNNALLTAVGRKIQPTGDRLKDSPYVKDSVDTYFNRAYDEAVKQGESDRNSKNSKF